MRELTKSLLSFSWAMSLFGLQQTTALFLPQTYRRTAGSFETVSRATEGQFGPSLRSTFQSFDRVQRGFVDLTFNFLRLDLLDPTRALGAGADLLQRSASATARATAAAADLGVQATSAAVGAGRQAVGAGTSAVDRG